MAETSTIALFARLLLSLGVVVGLMLLLAALLKRRGLAPAGRRTPSRAQVEVLARRTVGRNASVAVVRAAGKAMVLGVTESSITMLAEAELPEVDEIGTDQAEAQWTALPPGAGRPGSAWKTLLETLREKTVRRS